MTHKSSPTFALTPGNLARAIIVIAILGGLLTTYRTNPSSASVPPPGGDLVEKVFVDNIKGSDITGDGSETKPYATISKGSYRVNLSGAPQVQLFVRPSKIAYKMSDDIAPKRNNVDYLAWGVGRPTIIATLEGFRLYKFDIQKFSGIKLDGFDMQNMVVTIRGGAENIIRNNKIVITDVSKMIEYNSGAIINAGIWDYTQPQEYISENLTIDHNQLTVTSGLQNNQSVIGVRLESVRGAKVYWNSLSAGIVTAVVAVFDSIDSDFGANSNKDAKTSYPVYKFDHTNTSDVFTGWPF